MNGEVQRETSDMIGARQSGAQEVISTAEPEAQRVTNVRSTQ